MKERLQKILSASGVCSRRKGEELIAQGLVTVNGQKAQVGDSADPEKDIIAVRGKPLGQSPPGLYIMLHKPRGYVENGAGSAERRSWPGLSCGAAGYGFGRIAASDQ